MTNPLRLDEKGSMMSRKWIGCLFLGIALSQVAQGQVSLAFMGQSQNQKNKQDEKRENQRVEKAKKEVQQNQKELNEIVGDLRRQTSEWQKADAALRAANVDHKRRRETAEEQMGEESGYPKLLRSIRETRVKLDVVSKPIIERIQNGSSWQAAKAKADAARIERKRVLEDASLTDNQQKLKLESLDKTIAQPDLLQLQAIQADPEAQRLQALLDQQLEELEALRKKYPQSKIDTDPQVMKAKETLANAQKSLESEAKSLAALRSKHSKQIARLAAANQELARAQQADQADANNSRPKGKR